MANVGSMLYRLVGAKIMFCPQSTSDMAQHRV